MKALKPVSKYFFAILLSSVLLLGSGGSAAFSSAYGANLPDSYYSSFGGAFVSREAQGLYKDEFPDLNFCAAVLRLLNEDGGARTGESIITLQDSILLSSVTNLNVQDLGIHDMTGLSHFSGLKQLFCGYNQLTELDVSQNTALTSLYCGANRLTTLDVSHNILLENLYCFSNQLATLVVSENTALKTLNCAANKLTNLVVANSTALERLYCDDNLLTALDVSGNTLFFLYCTLNRMESPADVIGWQEQGLILDATLFFYPQMTGNEVGVFKDLFPDSGFRAVVLRLLNEDGGIRTDDSYMTFQDVFVLSSIVELNVQGLGVSDMTGLSYFSGLRYLWCGDNHLSELDVTANASLEQVACGGNNLSALDVSANAALTTLVCWDNQLTALDVAANTALYYLSCTGNRLQSLNITKNTALKQLFCADNQLIALDVSANTALLSLSCGGNQLPALDVSNNTALESLSCADNQLTNLNVSNNTALTVLFCNNNHLLTEDAIAGLGAIRNQLGMYRFYDQYPQIAVATQPVIQTNVIEGSIGGSLSVMVAATQGGNVGYQWYSNTSPNTNQGTVINGAVFPELSIPTDLREGKYYYYCIADVTNSLGTASAISDMATVIVGAEIETIVASGAVLYQPSDNAAMVTLSDSKGDFTVATETGPDGSYTLNVLRDTSYTLTVSKPGYLSYTIKNLVLGEGGVIETIDISQLGGDVNGDGIVNSIDLTYLLSEFNRAPQNYPNADIDGDGIVNSVDLTYLLSGFNKRDVVVE